MENTDNNNNKIQCSSPLARVKNSNVATIGQLSAAGRRQRRAPRPTRPRLEIRPPCTRHGGCARPAAGAARPRRPWYVSVRAGGPRGEGWVERRMRAFAGCMSG